MQQKKYVISLFSIVVLLLPGLSTGLSTIEDIDPLVDLSITIDILKIRSLEKDDPQVNAKEIIDQGGNPDFYVKLFINNHEFISDTYWNVKYLYNPNFSVSYDIPDDEETVDIVVQLWDAADSNIQNDRLCDISPDSGSNDDSYDVELSYNVKNGHWTGDDQLHDLSGYGRLNGCDDGTIYEANRDCELWFTISQNDFDQDQIPYYMETMVYQTDPQVNDAEIDYDADKIPTWWEWKYEYNPKQWDDHENIDDEVDGINNYEEFLTSQWNSDPFTRDVFMELDQMDDGPNGESCQLPKGSKEILYTAYNRQNVIYHLDDGSWGEESGSDIIPFDAITECSWRSYDELDQIYDEYYNRYNEEVWRRGVFHYGVVIYQSSIVNGNQFGSNRFQISAKGMEEKLNIPWLQRDIVYASAYMHETGHTFNFRPIPGHNTASYYPWQLGFWLSRTYKSCMNYGYMYTVVDYSDGSRPFGDYDDWERMDLTSFQNDW